MINKNKFSRKLYNIKNKIQFLFFIIFLNLKLFFNKKVFPYKITIKLNNNCNLNCNYCNIWKNKEKNILDFSKLKNFIKIY